MSTRDMYGNPLVAGVNKDHVNVSAGLAMLEKAGWSATNDPNTHMLIEFCLMRHARGEEAAAQAQAIGQNETDPAMKSSAIDLISWYMVLAAAITNTESE